MGFGLWVMLDNQSFITVLRKYKNVTSFPVLMYVMVSLRICLIKTGDISGFVMVT